MKGIIFCLFLVGCSSMPTADEQKYSVVVDTALKKMENYKRVRSYLIKSYGDPNKTIKSDDPSEGTIISMGLMRCNEISEWGLASLGRLDLAFTLTTQTKDKRVRFLFEDLRVEYSAQGSSADRSELIAGKENQKQMKICLDRTASDFKNSLKSGVKEDW